MSSSSPVGVRATAGESGSWTRGAGGEDRIRRRLKVIWRRSRRTISIEMRISRAMRIDRGSSSISWENWSLRTRTIKYVASFFSNGSSQIITFVVKAADKILGSVGDGVEGSVDASQENKKDSNKSFNEVAVVDH